QLCILPNAVRHMDGLPAFRDKCGLFKLCPGLRPVNLLALDARPCSGYSRSAQRRRAPAANIIAPLVPAPGLLPGIFDRVPPRLAGRYGLRILVIGDSPDPVFKFLAVLFKGMNRFLFWFLSLFSGDFADQPADHSADPPCSR